MEGRRASTLTARLYWQRETCPKPTPAEKGKITKKLNAIRRWYAYMLAEDKLDVRYKPAG